MRLPAAGEIFEGKYEIRDVLGSGGFATVFRATDTEIGRDVAIKVLSPLDGKYHDQKVARFMAEARVIAGLQDPHTIKLFDFGESAGGLLYMVFQFVAGADLVNVLRARGALPAEVVVHITRQILQALAEAHRAGVLHRDIKPANILIHGYMGDQFSAKLLDFGIAKVNSPASGPVALTREGALLGTPRYMSPEQVYGEPVGPWSDIYSLGLVAFEMLIGEPAIRGDAKEILEQQVSSEPLRLPEAVGSPGLRQVIERMVARDPAQRFRSAVDVMAALDALRQGAKQLSREPETTASDEEISPSVTHEEPRRGDRGWWAFVAGVLLCSGVAVAVAYMSEQTAPITVPTSPGVLPTALLEAAEPRPTPSVKPITVVESAQPDVGPDLASATGEPLLAAYEFKGDGCGIPHRRRVKDKFWMDIFAGGHRRTARVYSPMNYDPNRRYPLILALQPSHIDEANYAARAALNYLENAVVVAVSAADRFSPWVASSDVAVLRAAVVEAARTYCIDRHRIFASGHGAGGRMARELACATPLSGIAVSGNSEDPDQHSCTPVRPVPMVFLAAVDDPVVPVEGGEGCMGDRYMSADEHDAFWKARNACEGAPRQLWNHANGKCNVWTCKGAPYASCRVDGGHHLKETAWSILDPAGCAAKPVKMELGPAIVKFFETHGQELP